MSVRLPIRTLLPLLILLFAAVVSLVAFTATRRETIRAVEEEQLYLTRNRLTVLQGLIENMLTLGRQDPMRQLVSLYGAAPDNGVLLLVGADGKVIISTRYSDVGEPWQALDYGRGHDLSQRVRERHNIEVRLSDDRQWIEGYAGVCRLGDTRMLRSAQCGFLFYRLNLAYHEQRAWQGIRRLAWSLGGGIVLAAFLLWLTLHLRLNTRTARLIATLERYGRGERGLRVGLGGGDELASIGASVDSLLAGVEADENRIRESEERFRLLVEQVPGTVYRCALDADWTMHYLSDGIVELTGYPIGDFLDNRVRSYASIIHPEDRQALAEAVETAVARREPFVLEYRVIRADGAVRWVLEQGVEAADATGGGRYLAGVIIDLTEQKSAEVQLAGREEMLRAMSESAHDAMVVIDADDTIFFWNRAAERLLGYSAEQALGRKFHPLVTRPEDQRLAAAGLEGFRHTGRGPVMDSVLEFVALHRLGHEIAVERSVAAFRMDDRWYAMGSLRDITERKAAERQLLELATTDGMTGLWNRRYFLEQAEVEFRKSSRYQTELAVLMFDVDHFKAVNDTHGHDTGDAVLIELARRCRQALREVDIVGRLGGEEFAALMPETDGERAAAAAERLRQLVAQTPFAGTASELAVTISVGVAARGSSPKNFAAMLKEADLALYRAKQAGRNRVEVADG